MSLICMATGQDALRQQNNPVGAVLIVSGCLPCKVKP